MTYDSHKETEESGLVTIPCEWKIMTLGDVAEYVNGYAFKPTDWEESGYPIIRIQNLTHTSDKYNYYKGTLDNRYLVKHGDLLISWSASLGIFKWEGDRAWLNQHIFKVVNYSSSIDKNYFFFAVLSRLEAIRGKTRGSTMKHVNRRDFLATPIFIPPNREQKNIATIIVSVQEAKEKTEVVIASLKELKKSVMSHLFTYGPVPITESGKVQVKQFLEGYVPASWTIRPLVELLREPLKNGHSAIESPTLNGIRTLILSAVTNSDFSIVNTKITLADPNKVKALWLKKNDIFIERANTKEMVGTAAMYSGDSDYAIFPDLLIRVRVNENIIDSRFLVEFLRMDGIRRYYQQNASGAAGNMPKIRHSIIENTPIAFPDMETQHGIIEILSAIDIKIELEKRRFCTLEQMFLNLLDNLMTGKLRVNNLEMPT